MASQLTATAGLTDEFLSSDEEEEEELVVEDDNTNVIFDKNYNDIDNGDDDANINDFATDKYDFNQRMHHYMEFCAISLLEQRYNSVGRSKHTFNSSK